MATKYLKHTIHLFVMYSFIIIVEYGTIMQIREVAHQDADHELNYLGLILLAIQCIVLLPIPQMVSNLLGLTIFNTFPGDVAIRVPASKLVEATSHDANGHTSTTITTTTSLNKNICTTTATTTGITLAAQTNYDNNNNSNANNNCTQITIHANGHSVGETPPAEVNGSAGLIKDPAEKTSAVETAATLTYESMHSLNMPVKAILAIIPHFCIRVVTRGLYPELVQNNVRANLRTCLEAGLTNFSIEVVTDLDINISPEADERVRQIVVPKDYESSTKARFKSRALQYALEPGSSPTRDEDIIIHLDEETIMTRNVIHGIINFALEGKHAFGQGVITYANLGIVNIFTTLADSFRVSDDMGKIRFTLGALHKSIFGWKGSFVVSRCGAEKDVSFDHGEDGSIAEDCYFSMIALKKGYTFDFIQGEMYEKSPFTLLDLMKQRKRWLQGIWLVVNSAKIPWATKFFLTISFLAWVTMPLNLLSFANLLVKVPFSYYLGPMGAFNFSMAVYMYLFGLVKSFDLKRRPAGTLIVYVIAQFLTIGLYPLIENIVVIWGVFGNKHNFYIVKKEAKLADAKDSIIANF